MAPSSSFTKGYKTGAEGQPEQFARLGLAIASFERLREPIASAFEEKLGIDLIEGYSCTEMAPVVAVDVAVGRGPGRGTATAATRGPASPRKPPTRYGRRPAHRQRRTAPASPISRATRSATAGRIRTRPVVTAVPDAAAGR